MAFKKIFREYAYFSSNSHSWFILWICFEICGGVVLVYCVFILVKSIRKLYKKIIRKILMEY